jgi:hypothetical protein
MVEQSKQIMELKGKWKGLLFDYDYILEQDNSIVYVLCLTELERQILLSAIMPAGWKTRWYSNTQDISEDNIDTWVSNTIYALLKGCDAVGCYEDCTAISIMINIQNEMYINTLIQIYDGTPSSVNVNCPDDYFDADGSDERIMALCMALNSWVKSYVSAWLQKASIILALGIVGLFFFAVPVLGWVAVVLIGGLGYVTSTYYDALKDEEAIENVICDWFDALQGTAISKANWASTLSGLTYDGGTNEYLIWQILDSETSYDKQWVSFCDALGNAWALASAGVSECPCDECEPWEHEIDFTAADGDFTAFYSRGIWESGYGWKRGTGLAYAIQLDSTTYTQFRCTGIKVEVSVGLTGRRLGQFRIPDASGTSYDVTVPSGETEWTITIPGDGRDMTTMWFGLDTYNNTYNGYITKLTFYGCGYNPFA